MPLFDSPCQPSVAVVIARRRSSRPERGITAQPVAPIRSTVLAAAPLLVVGVLLVVAQRAFAQQAGIFYVYDDLNRLIAVIDQQGNVGMYTHDAVGNLLRVDRFDANQQPGPVRITLVTPSKGKVGTPVASGLSCGGYRSPRGASSKQEGAR